MATITFRKIIFWCHLPVGVIAGLVVLTMSVTGALLAYERQIESWADTRGYRVGPAAAGVTRLSAETLLGKVREARPDLTPAAITLRAAPTAPAAIGLGGDRVIYADPYTGQVLGEGCAKTRNFFRTVTDLHRWLGASGDQRPVGRAITGACNLGFLFLVLSGFYLWWPRKWNWSQVRNVLWFKRGLDGKARDFNWHNVIGFWSAVPLFIIVISGAVISYPWASNLVYRLVGETPPPRNAPGPAGNQRRENARRGDDGSRSQPAAPPLKGLDDGWSRAEQQVPGWQSISVRIPASEEAPLTFTIDEGNGGQPQKRGQLTFERKSGEVTRWEPFSSFTSGRKLRTVLRFAHTGEVIGLIGQTLAGLVSIGAAVLVWTGLFLSWRRLRAWRARRSRMPVPATSPLPDGVSETGGSNA